MPRGRGNGNIFLTTKCKCGNSEHWRLAHKSYVEQGKNFGKAKYLIQCCKCGSQWNTFSNKGLKEE